MPMKLYPNPLTDKYVKTIKIVINVIINIILKFKYNKPN